MSKQIRIDFQHCGENNADMMAGRADSTGRRPVRPRLYTGDAMRQIRRWLRTVVDDFVAGGPRTATRLRKEVIQSYEAGRLDDAVVAARRLLSIQKKSVGERHPDYATGLVNLSLLLEKRGDPRGAALLVEQALEIRHAALGPTHPEAILTESHLAELRRRLDPAVPVPVPSAPEPMAPVRPERLASVAATPAYPTRVIPKPLQANGESEKALDRAISVLDTVADLAFEGRGELAELRECQRAAVVLRSAIQADPRRGEVRSLAGGTHPLAALLFFVERAGNLDDSQWADAYATIGAAFGSPIAKAITRGQIRMARPPATRTQE